MANLRMVNSGSSPRLWGTRPKHRRHHHHGRFIPTPVGNTLTMPDKDYKRAVQPHACGEHLRETESESTVHG